MDRTERNRLDIAESLNELLREKDISKVTVVELCRRTGLSRSTFYSCFDDIYHVGEWIWDRECRTALEGIGAKYGCRQGYRILFERLATMGGRLGLVRPLRDDGTGETYAEVNTLAMIARAVERARGSRLAKEEREQLSYVSQAQEAMTLKWFRDGMALPPDAIAGYLADILPSFVTEALGE